MVGNTRGQQSLDLKTHFIPSYINTQSNSNTGEAAPDKRQVYAQEKQAYPERILAPAPIDPSCGTVTARSLRTSEVVRRVQEIFGGEINEIRLR